jgi:hypothetical protein
LDFPNELPGTHLRLLRHECPSNRATASASRCATGSPL